MKTIPYTGCEVAADKLLAIYANYTPPTRGQREEAVRIITNRTAAPMMYAALEKANAAMKTMGWGKTTWLPLLDEVAADVQKALAAAREGGAL